MGRHGLNVRLGSDSETLVEVLVVWYEVYMPEYKM